MRNMVLPLLIELLARNHGVAPDRVGVPTLVHDPLGPTPAQVAQQPFAPASHESPAATQARVIDLDSATRHAVWRPSALRRARKRLSRIGEN